MLLFTLLVGTIAFTDGQSYGTQTIWPNLITTTTPPPETTTPSPETTTPLSNGSISFVPSVASPSTVPTTMFPDFSTTLPPDFPVVAALRLKIKTFRELNSTSASQLLQQFVQQYLPYYSPQNLRMTIRSIKEV
ncbi:hypothetical protein MHYP_G00002370 [Metynnis hypsauchen]